MIQNDSSLGAVLSVPILLLHILPETFLSKGKMPEDKFLEDFCQMKASNEAKKHMGSCVASGAFTWPSCLSTEVNLELSLCYFLLSH